MYLYKKQARKILQELIEKTISELKNNHKFMISLLADDDWSLVIKSHALVESTVNNLIVAVTEENALRYLIERLPMHNPQIGKLKITKEYDLLSDGQRRFIRRLSELRNRLVHNIENIDFDFQSYIKSLDDNQRKAWKKDITWHTEDSEAQQMWEEISIESPKYAFWFAIFMLVSINSAKTVEISSITKINEIAADVVKKDFRV